MSECFAVSGWIRQMFTLTTHDHGNYDQQRQLKLNLNYSINVCHRYLVMIFAKKYLQKTNNYAHKNLKCIRFKTPFTFSDFLFSRPGYLWQINNSRITFRIISICPFNKAKFSLFHECTSRILLCCQLVQMPNYH